MITILGLPSHPYDKLMISSLFRDDATFRVQTHAGVQYDIDPDNASILVCGGGGVALHVTRKLKNMGSWVWQLQRTDVRRKEIEGMMAIVAKGDALNTADVDKVFSGEYVGSVLY